jgi:hypothetical protein
VAAGSSAPGVSGGPSSTPPLLAVRSPVLWALLTCLLLFGLGFGLNLATAPAGASGGVASAERAGWRGALRGGAGVATEMARFAAAVVAILGAQALGAVRRARG